MLQRMAEWLGFDSKISYKNKTAYIINGCCFIMAFIFSIFYIFLIRYTAAIPGILTYFFSTIVVFFLLKKRAFRSAKFLIVIGFLMQETSIVFYLFSRDTHFSLFYFILAPIIFFIYDYDDVAERKMTYVFTASAILLFLLSEILPNNPNVYQAPERVTQLFGYISVVASISLITIVFHFHAFELSKTHKELKKIANTDGLTSVYNRRFFFEIGTEQYTLAEKYDRQFVLILLDVDHFKHVNDTYGHPAGDRVLIQLTELIREQIRKTDVFSRYGGEEFAILVSDTKQEEGCLIAEKIRKVIMNDSFLTTENEPIHVTVSLGIVEFSCEFGSFMGMVSAADTALYNAKHSGRNCVVLYKA